MYFSKNKQLDHKIIYGEFKPALKLLNSIEEKNGLSENEILIKKYIQSFICLNKGDFKKGYEIAQEMMENAQEGFNLIREIDAIIAKVENNVQLNHINECLDLISQGELLLNNIDYMPLVQIKYREAYLFYLKGRLYQEMHKVHESIQYFKKAYKIRLDLKDNYGLIWALLSLGALTFSVGDFYSSQKYSQESLDLSKKYNNDIGIVWNSLNLGWIKFHKRDLESTFNYANKALNISEKGDYRHCQSHSYNLMGYYHLIKGESKEALDSFKNSLELNIITGSNTNVAQAYFSMGEVYDQKGQLKKSLEYYTKSLNTIGIDDKARLRSLYLSAIGKIYGELGDYSTAKKNLLEALELLHKEEMFILRFHRFSISIAKTYYYLIHLSIENNDLGDLDEYLEKLHGISLKNPESKQIDQLYRLDKAIILNSKERLRDKMQAAIIFEEISKENIIDHEITVEAMVNLCEVLIFELELTGDITILKEIEKLSDKILNIAQTQYLYNLLTETYILKAKISLIKLEIDEARMLLTKAQKIANEHDLNLLANKISNEHDSILANIDIWEERIAKNIPLQERINESKHEFLFSKMIRSKIEDLPIDADIPIYLVILRIIDGHCLYSKSFEDIPLTDGDLIAGFISAINMFGKEAFSSTGSIDRIRHGEYLIIFQSKNNFLFGYVFKGQSYSAMSKLEELVINILNSKTIFKDLKISANNYTEISYKTRLEIDNLCDQSFLKNRTIKE
ncbi:MAG: tetratricopeptide repeat protein [Candidatus Lokiarchaeota archaeon]|nr:tetratricopeptide repeat protein [Candidatus Lokiarchaeota archaeon]